VRVWEGAVEVAGRVVNKDESLRVTADGRIALDRSGTTAVNGVPRPDRVKVDPDLFRAGEKAVDPGLYVWVRDGTIQLARDGKSVDVTAGNAVVATADKIAVLDAVPNFMRFDPTPQPANGAGSLVADAFRAADGSFGICRAQ
jgi:hypothetical protein